MCGVRTDFLNFLLAGRWSDLFRLHQPYLNIINGSCPLSHLTTIRLQPGLNWKRTPDRSLATQSYTGTKKSKDRITIVLTSNADGSEKFLAWVIGKSENLRSFSKINRKNLRIIYS